MTRHDLSDHVETKRDVTLKAVYDASTCLTVFLDRFGARRFVVHNMSSFAKPHSVSCCVEPVGIGLYSFRLYTCGYDALKAKTQEEMETEAVLGLTKGHAYAVTAITKVRVAGTGVLGMNADKLAMIRLRNPWGPGSEWRGPFSDGYVCLCICMSANRLGRSVDMT